MTPQPAQLSLVFQGPVIREAGVSPEQQTTRRCIAQARAAAPGAEIVLSTWRGADVTGLDADQVILNEDPGSWLRDDGVASNVNRQILSTRHGLAAATRPYAAKLRTDTTLVGTAFLALQGTPFPRDAARSVFSQRILILEKYCRHPGRLPLLHHPSDLFQFGLTSDLRCLWSIPPARPDDTVGWASRASRPRLRAFDDARIYFRHADEQYVWIACLQAQGRVRPLDFLWQCRFREIGLSEAYLANNFLVVSESAAQVALPEKFRHHGWPQTCYTAAEWLHLMRLYAHESLGWKRFLRSLALYFASRRALLRTTSRAALRRFLK